MLNLKYKFFSEQKEKLKIKEDAESFEVSEILKDGTILDNDLECNKFEKIEKEGKFSWFVLEKNNYTTDKALKEIARALNVSSTRFNHAGTKDRVGLTMQMCSAFGIEKEKLLALELKDIKIKCAFSMDQKIKLGGLLGNKFKIKMAEKQADLAVQQAEKENFLFPNYFGMQRFGFRKNTHIVGYEIANGNYENAVMNFLADSCNEENGEARELVEKERNFEKAYEIFPKSLYLERMVLKQLINEKTDYIKALRTLPRSILLMFVHALQSYIFNEELYKRIEKNDLEAKSNEIKCGSGILGFPSPNIKGNEFTLCNIVGYNSELNEYEKEILSSLEIGKENFKISSMPELSCKGSARPLLSYASGMKKEKNALEFMLGSGSYATVFLSCFFDLEQ